MLSLALACHVTYRLIYNPRPLIPINRIIYVPTLVIYVDNLCILYKSMPQVASTQKEGVSFTCVSAAVVS